MESRLGSERQGVFKGEIEFALIQYCENAVKLVCKEFYRYVFCNEHNSIGVTLHM